MGIILLGCVFERHVFFGKCVSAYPKGISYAMQKVKGDQNQHLRGPNDTVRRYRRKLIEEIAVTLENGKNCPAGTGIDIP